MNDIEKEKIEELILEIGAFYEGNDWLVVKKYILKYLHPTIRKNFSTRNAKTKKHTLSLYDKEVIDLYYEHFKVRLILNEKNTHK
jgi:hypothetical protein